LTALKIFRREYDIFTNFVHKNMCFSFTALLAWHGQRRNVLFIALTTKGNAILIGWWAVILAFREINNNHFLGFPLDQRVVTFCFGLSSFINSSGGKFLLLSSGL
jgi:hypothetical protein